MIQFDFVGTQFQIVPCWNSVNVLALPAQFIQKGRRFFGIYGQSFQRLPSCRLVSSHPLSKWTRHFQFEILQEYMMSLVIFATSFYMEHVESPLATGRQSLYSMVFTSSIQLDVPIGHFCMTANHRWSFETQPPFLHLTCIISQIRKIRHLSSRPSFHRKFHSMMERIFLNVSRFVVFKYNVLSRYDITHY